MELWEVIVKYNGNIEKIKQSIDAEVEIISENYAIVTLAWQDIYLLYAYPEVEYIEQPKELSPAPYSRVSTTDAKKSQQSVTEEFAGKDVLVAVLDSGIDYLHPDFRNEDGTTRILYLWDQSDSSGLPPQGFTAGTEYTKNQIDAALESDAPLDLVPEVDYNGHGTAICGIAAGNGRASGGVNRGDAHEASLLIVKLGRKGEKSFAQTTEMMRALAYTIRKAQELNMPVAINISYGTNDGSHDSRSLFETFITDMAEKWKNVIVVAAGNEGSGGHHYTAKIKQGQTLIIQFTTSGLISTLFLDVWKNYVDYLTFELIAPNGETTGLLDEKKLINAFILNQLPLGVFFLQPNHYNEEQEIFFKFSPTIETPVPEGVWTLKVNGASVVDGTFHIWLPTNEQVTEATAFLTPSPELTVTLPSTAQKVLTVGGYNWMTGAIASFSSRGYVLGGTLVKPDLVASAVDVIAPSQGGGYDSFTGTSFAAPHATGAAAALLGWGIASGNDPFLYGQKIKSYMKLGADREEDMTYPNSIWGYGKLSLPNTFALIMRGR